MKAALVGALVMTGAAYAETLLVPDDYEEIQLAIDAAIDGDVIQVRGGTYYELLDFLGKTLVVESIDGAATTVIDAEGIGSVVTFDDAEPAGTELRGFTLIGGAGTGEDFRRGGAIYCDGASPLVVDCVIRNNHVSADGGAVYCRGGGTPVFRGCTMHDNSTAAFDGGAIYCVNAEITVEDCAIVDNRAATAGGGILLTDAVATIRRSVITRNSCDDDGGAINASESDVLLEDNVILGNTCADLGGGVHFEGGDLVAIGNKIEDNGALTAGGGMHIEFATVRLDGNLVLRNLVVGDGGGLDIESSARVHIVRNVVTGNTAGGDGGGIRVADATTYCANNTVTENTALGMGGGMRLVAGSTTIAGCILATNKAGTAGGGVYGDDDAVATVINCTVVDNLGGADGGGLRLAAASLVRNSIVRGNIAMTAAQTSADLDVVYSNVEGGRPGAGNIDEDAALDAAHASNDCATGLELGDASALPLDVADLDGDGDVTERLPVDIDGDAREVGSLDLGADELAPIGAPCPTDVDCNGNGIRDAVDIASCDGSAWCEDCNDNGKPDECDLVPTATFDAGLAYWRFESGTNDDGPCNVQAEAIGIAFGVETPTPNVPRHGLPNAGVLEIGGTGAVIVDDPWSLTSFGSDEPRAFTIEAWVRLDELSDGMTRQYLVHKHTPGTDDATHDYSLLVQSGDVQDAAAMQYGKQSDLTGRELAIVFGTGAKTWTVTSTLQITNTDWHHVSVAYAYDDLTRVRFGIDGSFETWTIDAAPARHADATGDLVIGAHRAADDTLEHAVTGAVDELRVSAGVVDTFDLLAATPTGFTEDCNGNGIPDECDIAAGTSEDVDGNGWPDECLAPCLGDYDGNAIVNVDDLVLVLANWENPYTVDDLLLILTYFETTCP